MFSKHKSKSCVSILRDREYNYRCAPIFSSFKVLSELIRSDRTSLYNNYSKKCSRNEIKFEAGHLYFNSYKNFCVINGFINDQTPLSSLSRTEATKNVADVITYTTPVYKDIDKICSCLLQRCSCTSQYIVTLSYDNYLCKHLFTNGELMHQIYVNRAGYTFSFRYIDWDVYGDRFILTSVKNPIIIDNSEIADIVVNLAIFTTFPIEFFALLEIKRSVFGENCNNVNVDDHHLMIGLGNMDVHIYNFEDFLNNGKLQLLFSHTFFLMQQIFHFYN